MKFRILAAIAAALFAAVSVSAPGRAAPVAYKIDTTHAWVHFRLGHLGFASALGSFSNVTGEVKFDADNPAASSVNASIDVKSVNTGFDKRDQWVLSDKALNAAKSGAITFKSTKIEVTGKNKAKVSGDLTMNGVTKPVVLDVTFNKKGTNPLSKKETVGFSATASLKRSDFGVTAFLGPLGDEVRINIELEAFKP